MKTPDRAVAFAVKRIMGSTVETSMKIVLSLWLFSGSAAIAKTDTLTGLPPGDLIGCNYTFNNGSPSIPCARDRVAADGTVSFLKPDANYNNIEYFEVTTGDDLVEVEEPDSTPIFNQLTPGTKYPIVRQFGGSFFDVFTEINLAPFNANGQNSPGFYNIGDTFLFNDGTSSALPNVTIAGFTGEAEISGFDVVGDGVPEPAAWALMAVGLFGLGAVSRGWRRLGKPSAAPGPARELPA